jgi:hypothetical protein
VFLKHLALLYFVTIGMWFRLCIIMYFTNALTHIEINCHFVHHHLLQGTLCLCPIRSADQLADVFTKLHPP